MSRRARTFAWILAGALPAGGLTAACSGSSPAATAAPEPEAAEAVVETRWSERTELFMEYPPLVAGETSRFAVHFTNLARFEPVRTGRAEVRLSGADAQAFEVAGPDRPGYFGIDVTPARAGRYNLSVAVEAGTLADRHELGEVEVLPPGTMPDAGGEPQDDASIPFLKEQQWTLGVATAAAEVQPMADSLEIAATIEPRTGGQADVTTPVTGRLADDLPAWPVGAMVARGATLAEIVPQAGHLEDRPELDLAVAEARNALELVRADRARVERLVTVGALPERRRLESGVAERTAEARLAAAEEHLAQLDATRTGQGEVGYDTRFVLRAPLSGVVTDSDATAGASVEAGARLFRLVAVDRVHVAGALPEAALARIDELAGAELNVPGFDAPLKLDRLVAVGRELDPAARTVPITYELRNPDRRIAIGQAVSLRVFISAPTAAVTVPESALVDDAGQPVVFVQTGGESFARRAVVPGNREGGHVQVAGDIAPGERVVIRGAPFIRLAALSPQAPAHGHVH
ncbi:MAG: efflux RND transporter periplasmic adaptor subunit [Acidobacteria bacterium]|nr:efflux RND transporter periplasmic adaptor subunit [Acidobacteriota bacterium]MYI73979.1 efflux RND transporter periplasmic adaptor subunit [Acidobacteriota bacterium]